MCCLCTLPLSVEGNLFVCRLVCLPLRDLDLILGMVWLVRYHVLLDCAPRMVVFQTTCRTTTDERVWGYDRSSTENGSYFDDTIENGVEWVGQAERSAWGSSLEGLTRRSGPLRRITVTVDKVERWRVSLYVAIWQRGKITVGNRCPSPKTDAYTDQLRGGGVFRDRLEVGLLSSDEDEGWGHSGGWFRNSYEHIEWLVRPLEIPMHLWFSWKRWIESLISFWIGLWWCLSTIFPSALRIERSARCGHWIWQYEMAHSVQ
jgi:hypothetical protein